MEPAHVFVLGLDEKNTRTLNEMPHADQYRFLRLLEPAELQRGEIRVAELIEKARAQLAAYDGPVDAIVGYWDFPVSSMVPLLCGEYGLRGASLEAVVKCEHKFWSRLEQRKVVDAYPPFALLDLADDAGRGRLPENLRYPVWIKPVKSYSSELAYRVEDDEQFRSAVATIKEGIGRLGKSFDDILQLLDLPAEVAEAGGEACVVEEALSGAQATAEGFSRNGQVEVYGIVDSLVYPGTSSFMRYQYPSALPARTQGRMAEISKKVIKQIGLDDSTFCIEFFCRPETGDVSILEINPRHSQSHAELFEHVDGVPNHHCMLSLALGRDPRLPYREGPYALAAKCHLRRFRDGVVRRRASDAELERLARDVPGVQVVPVVGEGSRLSETTQAHDSYSYELAHVYVAADDEEELERKYERAVAALGFRFDNGPDDGPGTGTDDDPRVGPRTDSRDEEVS
ncbi:ATP-grasp domain-containing protein [Streptomyces armeniacus]|uniref:ATP-grasp domain-containing protein n=1 Tax=Streptomyces armeniacus TaxID=83291 RepID=A0A345XIZ4_9ACTN|nr:ATP-grasp domain-containing protein [Streptomyces armeniacus]AXK31610.1 ATP-grasp domain-containing protein [Streptomyces armeniacus]